MFVYFFSGSDSSGVTLRASQLDGVEKRSAVFMSHFSLCVISYFSLCMIFHFSLCVISHFKHSIPSYIKSYQGERETGSYGWKQLFNRKSDRQTGGHRSLLQA